MTHDTQRISSRERILQRLRERHRPSSLPEPWETRRRFEDLAKTFARAVEKVGGEAYLCDSWDEVWARVDALLREMGARQAAVNGEATVSEVDWRERHPHIRWFYVGKDEGDLRAFCAQADVGLSGAAAALAETGSVILESGQTLSRMATLLPPVHIAVIPREIITTDLFTWTAERKGEMPAAITIVTGPSKTADIEQTLAVGVHGPKRYIVIVGP